MANRLLLISSSTVHGTGYLDHCESEIKDFLGALRQVLFVPFAIHDRAGYAERFRERLGRMGLEVASLNESREPRESIRVAESIFVGGGNTFRLLKALYDLGLMDPIRRRVERGAPYLGTSAGSNVAGATIKTTNDMPIVLPPSLDALRLVPFNLNPHYLDPDPASTHMGETREERIREFHEENDATVVGLREGALLRVEGRGISLRGAQGARLFVKGASPQELAPGATLDFLLDAPP